MAAPSAVRSSDSIHSKFTKFTIFLFLIVLITSVYYKSVLIVSSFILYLVAGSFFGHWFCNIPLPLASLIRIRSDLVPSGSSKLSNCVICGLTRCSRDHSLFNEEWRVVKIPKTVDDSLAKIFEQLIHKQIHSWYYEMSKEEAFVNEIRYHLRCLAGNIVLRLSKVDINRVLSSKLLKVVLKHVDCCLLAKGRQEDGATRRETEIISYFGSYVHVAVRTREGELQYIQSILDQILPLLLPKHATQSRLMLVLVREILAASVVLKGMDCIADPDILNNILIRYFKPKDPVAHQDSSPLVNILENFSQRRDIPSEDLVCRLSEILRKDSELLFPFMQFLKGHGGINMLNFCLSFEDFNSKLLNPDLSPKTIDELHQEARTLYSDYFAMESPNRLDFTQAIADEFESILAGPPEMIIKRLQTSTPLFRAYEQIYNQLETEYCTRFAQSWVYFDYMLSKNDRGSLQRSSSSRSSDKSVTSKLGNKVKKLFRPTSMAEDRLSVPGSDQEDSRSLTGSLLDEDEEGSLNSEKDVLLTDELQSEDVDITVVTEEILTRDMSTWKVKIPYVEGRPDESGKAQGAFVIKVVKEANGTEPRENWVITRRYNEFYLLEAKLKEFHGNNMKNMQLPSKKNFGAKSFEFLQSVKAELENFINALLKRPALKSSELLHTFLTATDEFKPLADINLGKMIKDVPLKLRIEKGQSLEPFLQSLLHTVTESRTHRRAPSNASRAPSPLDATHRKLENPLFDNNCNMTDGVDAADCSDDLPTDDDNLTGFYDYLLYLAQNVYEVPQFLLFFLFRGRNAFKATVDTHCDYWLSESLSSGLTEENIKTLLDMLYDAVFGEAKPPRSDAEKSQRREEAFQVLLNNYPGWIQMLAGQEYLKEKTRVIFDFLQNPVLNKQLSYVILDCLLVEVFPELQKT